MRRSQLFIKTRRQAPADETAHNAQLLIRAGYIHKEMAGVYSFLPLGKIVLDKITKIIREEMDAIGASEVIMSTLQNKILWEKTGRWDDKVVDNWFKTKLANGSEVGIGLSHEEPLTNALTNFVNSYKDLPVYLYQIQTKFRNELRAKSGLMRGREFLMKDLYSFSSTTEEHTKFYSKVSEAYLTIYERLGIGDITFKTFASGGIFSEFSHEFQVLSHVGEDTIYIDKSKKQAVNKEVFNPEVLAKLDLDEQSLTQEKAVEVGNIFSLGSKYSNALGLFYTDESGRRQSIIMGCYGIGVSRLMGLLAEHFADEKGLVWPENIAPAKVYLAGIGKQKDVTEKSERIYNRLTEQGISVIYDDRDLQVGEVLNDADLLGLPLRLIISEKSLSTNSGELKRRTSDELRLVPLDKVIDELKD